MFRSIARVVLLLSFLVALLASGYQAAQAQGACRLVSGQCVNLHCNFGECQLQYPNGCTCVQ